MIDRFRRLWQHHKGLTIAFSLACAVTVFFVLRSIVFYIYWQDPTHRNQPLEPWMTPRYIAYSYDLLPEDVAGMLGIAEIPTFRPTLEKIAAEKGIPVSALIEGLKTQLTQARREKP